MGTTDIRFEEKFLDGYGRVSISGSELSKEIIAALWAKFRKHVQKEYSVDATISFTGNKPNATFLVICNGAYADRHQINSDIYFERFIENFQRIIMDFEDLIQAIAEDEDFTDHKDNKTKVIELAYKYQPDIDNTSREERRRRKRAEKARRVQKALQKKAAQQNT